MREKGQEQLNDRFVGIWVQLMGMDGIKIKY